MSNLFKDMFNWSAGISNPLKCIINWIKTVYNSIGYIGIVIDIFKSGFHSTLWTRTCTIKNDLSRRLLPRRMHVKQTGTELCVVFSFLNITLAPRNPSLWHRVPVTTIQKYFNWSDLDEKDIKFSSITFQFCKSILSFFFDLPPVELHEEARFNHQFV